MTMFKKGESGNIGGRPTGAKDRMTKDLRERISSFLNDNWDQIEKDFLVLQPEKRVMIFEKLLQYSLPRLQTTELKTPDPEDRIKKMTKEEIDARLEVLKKRLFPEAWEYMNQKKEDENELPFEN